MTINKLKADAALDWYKCGWNLFTKAPIIWVVMVIIIGLAVIIPALIPMVGFVISIFVAVLLASGFYYALQRADQGDTPTFDMLLQGAKDEPKRNALLILGAILLGVTLLVGLITAPFMNASISDLMTGGRPGVGGFGATMMLGLLVLLVIEVLIAMAVIYAIPLIMFDGQSAIDAIKQSFKASVTNVIPFVLFGVIYFALAMIAIIPFGLGMIVLIPVTMCAVYCSYRAIFGRG